MLLVWWLPFGTSLVSQVPSRGYPQDPHLGRTWHLQPSAPGPSPIPGSHPDRSVCPGACGGQPTSTYCEIVSICTELSNIITFLLSTALWYIYSNYKMFWACAQISSFRTIGYRSRGPVFESLSRHNSVCKHGSTVFDLLTKLVVLLTKL